MYTHVALHLFAIGVCAAANSPNGFFGGQDHQDYLDWVEKTNYHAAIFLPNSLDPTEGVAVHWNISDDKKYLDLGLAVRATGWFGWGISDNGGMSGSDMLLFEAVKPDVVMDAFVLDERFPQEDTCQDWKLLVSNTDSPNFLMIQIRRKLVTGDLQDLPIRNDRAIGSPVHRIIAAWGDTESVGYHGSKIARGSIRWFNVDGDEQVIFEKTMEADSDGTFFVGANEYPIKAQDTEYVQFCLRGDEIRATGAPIDQGGALIGFEPIVDNKEHVHHYLVFASYEENNNVTDCENMNAFDLIYIWAPGEPSFAMAESVMFPLGGDSPGYKSFQIEIHYDNPGRVEGAIDSSGVKLYYSNEQREHIAGMLIVGDATVELRGQSISRGLAEYDFSCPSACSTLALDTPVTVLREYIHMHKSGVSGYTQQIRDGQVIRTGNADYFDFNQQGGHITQQDPYEVLPGDAFNTKCIYKNEEEGEKFGMSSSDEMCQTFFLYYPRKTITSNIPWLCGIGLEEMGLDDCAVTWTNETLQDDAIPRNFGKASTRCEADDQSTVKVGSGDDMSSSSSMSFSATSFLFVSIFILFSLTL